MHKIGQALCISIWTHNKLRNFWEPKSLSNELCKNAGKFCTFRTRNQQTSCRESMTWSCPWCKDMVCTDGRNLALRILPGTRPKPLPDKGNTQKKRVLIFWSCMKYGIQNDLSNISLPLLSNMAFLFRHCVRYEGLEPPRLFGSHRHSLVRLAMVFSDLWLKSKNNTYALHGKWRSWLSSEKHIVYSRT